ncbi:MAG: rod shape-determining protein, partial [Lachnospiraceae bacterium]|nr:rod shape-determining protein [Lachnospiraceae bacterium]
MPVNAFGIDLGTSNIKIFNGMTDTIASRKNMIAVQKMQNHKTVMAYGDEAFEMFEKAPANITVSQPVTNGVIAEIQHSQLLLHRFIMDEEEGYLRSADFFLSVPTDITEVEKRAFFDLVKDSNVKARNIFVVEKAI